MWRRGGWDEGVSCDRELVGLNDNQFPGLEAQSGGSDWSLGKRPRGSQGRCYRSAMA